jgi:GNAT superfamily N-acetyltransferase
MKTHLIEAPFSDAFIAQFVDISERVFGQSADQAWLDALHWRLEKMPDVTVFVAEVDGTLVGYPEFRGQGIGKLLMDQQHAWLQPSPFKSVETHVAQDNAAMVQLNLKSGLTITGMFSKEGEPNFIMKKVF